MRTQCTLNHTTFSGFDAIELKNETVSLTLVPEIGGKIVSLIHRPSQREWLALNPHLPLRAPQYGESFTELNDTGGLDECFPSVSAIDYRDPLRKNIPDHGELWCQAWEMVVVCNTDEKIVIDMQCDGIALPYRFKRRLSMTADSPDLTLDYEVSNLFSHAIPFVWSIHPILQIEEGMKLSLPDSVETLRIDGATEGFIGGAGDQCAWPIVEQGAQQGLNLSQVPGVDFARAAKFYTLPLSGNEMLETCLQDASGEHAIGFRFHPSEVTHIGLWMNYGGWSGCGSAPYYNLGLEPCIGGRDSIEEAQAINEFATLEPRQKKQWSLELFVR